MFVGFLLIIIFPPFISILFGKEWSEVSKIIIIISPMVITDFIVSTLSSTFEIINRPRDGFYAQILLTVIRLAPFILLSQNNTFNYLITSFSISSSIGYFVYYLIIKRAIFLSQKTNT